MDSILQKSKVCYYCGTTIGLHRHHIFFGKNRKLSEEDGCVVYLCYKHHTGVFGIHNNHKMDLELKKKCEEAWLKRYDKSIEEFIGRYGKNYL